MLAWEERRYRTEDGGDPSGKTPIAGEAKVSAEELERYAERRQLRIGAGSAEAYLAFGRDYGIRGDVAFCQALYETRMLSSRRIVPLSANRLPDLWGVAGRDELWTDRFVEEHIRLLYGFSTEADLPARRTKEFGRSEERLLMLEELGWRGKARFWEELGGMWSSSAWHYGQDIAAIWRNLSLWAGIRKERMERDRKKTAAVANGEG
ncbi:hypothetical protein [Cohnella sp. AR92]|uniref:hypothetical protein n=1 Tax=Cohnella sp. AR92 TaxID=648716 RepID=UPI000F8E020B|nr:hypothetical protein [Cohnella sp. AR92]RUS47464.1 hypothetical protein ELR57_10125 [Cohnella sp. AR92]